jgi:hypothetical protein
VKQAHPLEIVCHGATSISQSILSHIAENPPFSYPRHNCETADLLAGCILMNFSINLMKGNDKKKTSAIGF